MTTTTATATRDLIREWEALKQAEPKLRIRDAAARLGVSEAELLATRIGSGVTRLRPDFLAILQSLEDLGRVMALTRNEEIVHERKGVYKNIEAVNGHGNMGIAVNDDIDLRIFFGPWTYAFASVDGSPRGTMRSLQFFDASGDAIHKVFLTEASDVTAFDELTDRFAAADQGRELSVKPRKDRPVDRPDVEIDVEAFRTAWLNLKDTHDFFPMLMKHKVGREQALRLADPEFVTSVDAKAFRMALEEASKRLLPIMVFVGNHGMIQIHTGPVENVLEARGWFNVMDDAFNLHIDQERIARCYLVKKPTVDGIVTSIELFNREGENVALIFGKRKPGIPESEDWRQLVDDLFPAAT